MLSHAKMRTYAQIIIYLTVVVSLGYNNGLKDWKPRIVSSAVYLGISAAIGKHLNWYLAMIHPIASFLASAASVAVWAKERSQPTPTKHEGRKIKVAQHASMILPTARSPIGTILPIDDSAQDYKRYLNSLNEAEFNRARHHEVTPDVRKPSDVSRGAARLRILLTHAPVPSSVGNVIELGAGRGGWIQAMDEVVSWNKYDAYSRWFQKGQESLQINPSKYRVNAISGQIEHILARNCDVLLSDAGENPPQYADEVSQTLRLLRQLTKFVAKLPKYYIIRIPTIGSDEVIEILEGWQRILGGGHLVRLPTERNTVLTTYFVHGPAYDIRGAANGIIEMCIDRLINGKDAPILHGFMVDKKTNINATWPEMTKRLPKGVYPLLPLDLSEEIEAAGPLKPPIKTTHFLKEIGWKDSLFVGSSGTHRNYFGWSLIKQLTPTLHSYGLWKTTSTKAADTYNTVLRKVDQAPQEDHTHYNRMWACYKAIARFLKENTKGLRELSYSEIEDTINPKGAMGWQERDLNHASIGDYACQPNRSQWTSRMAKFEDRLLKGRPIWCSYNSIGKKERKSSTSSRLIWFLCATARLFEAQNTGHLDTLLKKLPYSVSGIPIYDYGEHLRSIFTKNRRAVCDDVAGWDTKISHGILSMECAFLEMLAKGSDHRKKIRALYRLYSHPLVMITRPSKSGVQDVLYQLRGQVASGRRITYSMNTITNIVVTMSRAAYSQNVPEGEMEDWALKRLRQGHTSQYGGKISGDDSAVILGPDEADAYANKGANFMNEIGMPRKNIRAHEPSPIYWNLDQIEFCSHSYAEVDMGNNHKRWMPVRGIDEILAKAVIMLGNIRSREQELAWARAQGLNLLVNYFHIPSVMIFGMALLSVTPKNISLDSAKHGWAYRIRPWIQEGDVIEIINNCLFGCSTTVPSDFRIKSIGDLGTLAYKTRKRFDTNPNNPLYINWRKGLYDKIRRMRSPDQHYDDWIPLHWSKDRDIE